MGTLSHAGFTRRSVLRGAAQAGLAAAVLPFALPAGPAKASNYRGIVGVIKPRATDSALVDMIKLLPDGIGVIPVYLNLTRGSREEYGNAYATYEMHIAYLASQKCKVMLSSLFDGVAPKLSHKATPCAAALGRGAY